MAYLGKTVLAVIPARGGSKGIARKNIQPVGGRSLIARAGAVTQALDWLDAAVISTDDPEMAAEGERAGLRAPFLRPADLAGHLATGVAAWAHAWQAAEEYYGERFDCSVLLQPTSPFRKPEEVEATLKKMLEGNHRAATTISSVPGHFTPQKQLLMDGEGVLSFLHADGARHSNRQTIPASFYRNGICYAAMRETVVDKGEIVEHDCVGVLIEGYIVNIDDPIDLEIAELLAARYGL